jgi:hypothetical protein
MSIPVTEFQGVVHVIREVGVHCNESVQFVFIHMAAVQTVFFSSWFDADNRRTT